MNHCTTLRCLALAALLCLGTAQACLAEPGAAGAAAAGTAPAVNGAPGNARGSAAAPAHAAGPAAGNGTTPVAAAIPTPSQNAPALETVLGGSARIVRLPAPCRTGGMPLMDALAARHSERFFSPEELSLQEVSDLSWAVCGMNREDGRRTLPTAVNRQRIGLYLVMKDGVYRYNPKRNELKQVLQGTQYLQMYDNHAPLVLLHAASTADRFSAYHIGSMYQNAALYCAAHGLANVPKWMENEKLRDALPLPRDWAVFIVQPVGHPQKNQ